MMFVNVNETTYECEECGSMFAVVSGASSASADPDICTSCESTSLKIVWVERYCIIVPNLENLETELVTAMSAAEDEVKPPAPTIDDDADMMNFVYAKCACEEGVISRDDGLCGACGDPKPATRIKGGCPICLDEEVSPSDGNIAVAIKGCGHVMHKNCVERWIKGESSTCPTCRAKIGNETFT
jgi:hypothetical protein